LKGKPELDENALLRIVDEYAERPCSIADLLAPNSDVGRLPQLEEKKAKVEADIGANRADLDSADRAVLYAELSETCLGLPWDFVVHRP
jgi:hypothetical protein